MAARAKRKPARKSARRSEPRALHHERFPNESRAYRSARNALLKAELELRRETEAVAALRRKLPLGGPVPEDYEFEEGAADLGDTQTVRRVRLSELFRRDASLAVYSYMYGPAMARACPMCTSSVALVPITCTPSSRWSSRWKSILNSPLSSPRICPRAISRYRAMPVS